MRYLRNILLLSLLLAAFLSAARDNLTFQGYITGADGNGYRGYLRTGVRIRSTVNAEAEVLVTYDSTSNISAGAYTIVVPLTTSNVDRIMSYDDIYMAIYLSILNTGDIFDINNLLTPNIQILGVPIALKARGVDVRHTYDGDGNNKVYTGSSLLIKGDSNSVPTGGVVVNTGGYMGIGTSAPNANLHVSANSSYALKTPTINGGTVRVNGGGLLNVKWE